MFYRNFSRAISFKSAWLFSVSYLLRLCQRTYILDQCRLFCCHNNGDNRQRVTGDNGNTDAAVDVNAGTEASLPIRTQPILSGYYKQFAKECLDEHNRFRALHGVPLVTLNMNLSSYAMEWARILAERDAVLIYRNEALYGENLFVAREYNVDGRTVVKSWYDEINHFNFERPEKIHGVDQFTQVVWKSTREIGVGIEKRGRNTWVVVNYDPKGNIPREFENNVIKPIQ